MRKVKPKPKPCTCPAYKFPHRLDSAKCKELYDGGSAETYENYKAELLRDFEREEARAINATLNDVRF